LRRYQFRCDGCAEPQDCPAERAEADGADHAAIGMDQIADLGAGQWGMTEVVVPLDQPVPEQRIAVVGLALWASRLKLNETTDSYLTSSPTHRVTGSRFTVFTMIFIFFPHALRR